MHTSWVCLHQQTSSLRKRRSSRNTTPQDLEGLSCYYACVTVIRGCGSSINWTYSHCFNLCLTLSKTKQSRVISFRKIRNINLADLTTGIENLSITTPPYTPDQLVDLYNDGLKSLLNSLAPVKTRPFSFPHSAPWFSPHLRQLKAKGRQLERLFNRTGLTVYKEMYYAHILHYKDAISSAKSQYFAYKISSGAGNTRALFSVVNNSLCPPDFLPPHFYSTDHCNSIMAFFDSKISTIHQHPDPSHV